MHEVIVWVLLGTFGVMYARGAAVVAGRSAHASHGLSVACFAAGWLALVLALLSPLDKMAEQLFSAHMVQHELIMIIAAPLIVIARPTPTILWAFSRGSRHTIGRLLHARAIRSAWHGATEPSVAWLIHGVVIWIWHIPGLFQLTLHSEVVHAVQHLSFFGSAVLFWWSVIQVRPQSQRGTAMMSLFATAIHTSVLGALLTFSRTPWYSDYGSLGARWGLGLVADQQLAGLIMWIPASVVYLVACLYAAYRYLRESEWTVEEAERASMAAAR
jgi:cytochrome c oxidase assembly factor CtaG